MSQRDTTGEFSFFEDAMMIATEAERYLFAWDTDGMRDDAVCWTAVVECSQ